MSVAHSIAGFALTEILCFSARAYTHSDEQAREGRAEVYEEKGKTAGPGVQQ
jgi:hypothetical protein